ncbi:MAG TPA: hypothetical protein VJA16_01115 [Thermoanaerobaculia bacterium]
MGAMGGMGAMSGKGGMGGIGGMGIGAVVRVGIGGPPLQRLDTRPAAPATGGEQTAAAPLP